MRTTIDLPDRLFREVKTRAVQEGRTLKDLVASYLEAGLRGNGAVMDSGVRKRAPLPVAIEREAGAPLTRARSNRELEDLLEEDEVEDLEVVRGNAPSES